MFLYSSYLGPQQCLNSSGFMTYVGFAEKAQFLLRSAIFSIIASVLSCASTQGAELTYNRLIVLQDH